MGDLLICLFGLHFHNHFKSRIITDELPYFQSRFLGRVAYDSGYQPATALEEGERLGRVLGECDIMFMCHHGTLVVADTVHAAFDEVRHNY